MPRSLRSSARTYPAMMSPPAGSPPTSMTARGQVSASARLVVVTPGEPLADASAMTATSAPGDQRDRDAAGVGQGRDVGEVTRPDCHVDDLGAIGLHVGHVHD